MDGALLRDGDRYLLRFERHFSHPVERVWKAITEPTERSAWFPGEAAIELAVGGEARFTQPGFEVDPELLPTRGTVVAFEPPRRFAFTWGEDLLSFELRAEGQGCTLVFTHSFAKRASAPRSGAGWNVCLDSLTTALGGRTTSRPGWRSYYDGYVDELGSNGTFARHHDQAELCFERLLDHDVEKVWEAISKPERLATWLADAIIGAKAGGRVVLDFATPVGYTVTGTVTRFEAPRALEYTWSSPGEPAGVVKWQLIPVGESCILLLTHTVEGHWREAGTLAAWDVHLSLLNKALAGLETWPFPGDLFEQLQVSYANTISAESGKVWT